MNDAEYNAFRESIKELVKNGYKVMLFHQGFGETVVFTQLLYRYKDIRQKKIVLLTKSSTRTEILRCCKEVDEVIELPEDVYMRVASDGELRIYDRVDNFLDLHCIVGINKENIRIQVCDYLGIPLDTPMKKYELPDVEANWDEFFSVKGLVPGKSVYIVPHAVFLGNSVPKEFYVALVDRLREEGYTPIVNTPEEYIEGVPFAYFDMITSITLAKKCGSVIGCRTGFMDLVAAFTDCRLKVIYPDDDFQAWDVYNHDDLWKEKVQKNFSMKYMEAWGLNVIFQRQGIEEYVYKGVDATIEEIF